MQTYSYYADGKWLEPADLPSGVINTVAGFGAEAGEPLVTHEPVYKISFKSVWLGTARKIQPPF